MNDITSFSNYISLFYRTGLSLLTKEFAKYKLGYGQIQFLFQLYNQDGLRHDELTNRVHVDKATTTRAIKSLCENGYATVVQEESDKRIYKVFLTPKAYSIKEEAFEIVIRWEKKLGESLNVEEQQQLLSFCKRIAINNHLLE